MNVQTEGPWPDDGSERLNCTDLPTRPGHCYAADGSPPSRAQNWAMSMFPPESVTPTV